MNDSVIVRYGEIFLKSEFVRKRFTERLVGNIKGILDREGFDYTVVLRRHRCYLKTCSPQDVALRVSRVFGVTSTSPALETEVDLDVIVDVALKYSENKVVRDSSFAVRAKKSGKQSFSTKDVEVVVGDAIRKASGARVDLTFPDTTVYIEVYGDKAFVFTDKLAGVGGLPYGTQGRLLAQVNSERDLLAAWMLMRRGCEILLVYDSNSVDLHENLLYFTPEISDYLVSDVLSPEKLVELAQSKKCLGIVSGLDPENVRKLELPHYTPLACLSDEIVSEKINFLRSCVK
ncbi:MAG: THUMP domain-containing protein [Methanobacteriota archaeon]